MPADFQPILLPHPRVLLTPARATAVLAFVANDTQAASYFRNLTAQAESILPLPPVTRPPDGGNVLGAARIALARTYVLAAAWRLTGNTTYAARALAEVLNYTTGWKDWQIEANGLVTGELCHASAIGLDWLYDYLSAAQRATIVAGILTRGLIPFANA